MKTTFNDLATITKSQLDTFLPLDKIINSGAPLYPFFNLRQGKEIIDYQKSELFLICSFSIFVTLIEKGLLNGPEEAEAFVEVLTQHLSEFITKDDAEYDLVLHIEDRIDVFHEEVKNVIKNGMNSDPVNCIYCVYKAPLIGQFLLSKKCVEFKLNNPKRYVELKEFFVSNLSSFQSKVALAL
jgi:hypothetical protein|tara:strand:- start:609 stop:1157 length:549 start_codon:yes stop_codon:yes gene_type:complete